MSSVMTECCCMVNPCHAEYIRMPCPLLIFNQSDYLIQVVDINSITEWQTVQIQISWLLQKPTDLDLHCLQTQGIYLCSAGQGLNRNGATVLTLSIGTPLHTCPKI